MRSTSDPSSWWQALRADSVPWLLDDERPNLLWRVLLELVERPIDSVAVRRARGGASAAAPVAAILAHLLPDGTWPAEGGAAPPVDDETGLQAAVFLGADPEDPRLQALADRLLDRSFRPANTAPCETARALQALARLGWPKDLRFQERLAWLAEEAPASRTGGWRCRQRGHAGADSGCAVTAVAVLGLLAEMGRTRDRGLLERASEALLEDHLWIGREPPDGWFEPGHPNLTRTDWVEALWALARARVSYDRRLHGALLKLQNAQDETGRWRMEARSVRTTGLARAEAAGKPSRWVTLHALVALKAYAVPAGLPRLFPEA